ncbi:MAG: substrate-binding domain-containing protein [Candidatus Deferrimicrobium sp.]
MRVGKRLGVVVAWIVPLFLGATMFHGNVHAETLRISGTGGAIGGIRLLAEAFRKAEPGVDVIILPSIGSGGGIRAVLAGKLDIGLSAMPLDAEERARGGRETPYARTPFVFGVNPDVKQFDVTLSDMIDIYSGRRTTWEDGSPIRLVLRPTSDSDTIALKRMSRQMAESVELSQKREGMIVAATDQVCADTIERTSGSVGTTTLALVVSEKRGIRMLSLSGVKPSTKSLRDGTYPYTKTFYAVTRQAPSPVAARFIRFVRSPEGKAILSRVGHVPLP